MCVTGFREAAAPQEGAGVAFQDSEIQHIYVRDDNLGPNVRMRVSDEHHMKDALEDEEDENLAGREAVQISPEAPERRYGGPSLPDPTTTYPAFVPEHLIVGVHEGRAK